MPDTGVHKRYFKGILRKARNENVKRSYVTVDADGKQEPARKARMESSTRKRNLYAEILVTVVCLPFCFCSKLSVKSYSSG